MKGVSVLSSLIFMAIFLIAPYPLSATGKQIKKEKPPVIADAYISSACSDNSLGMKFVYI